MSYNSHTMKFTPLKYAIQWFFPYSQSRTTITTIYFQSIFFTERPQTLHPIIVTHNSSHTHNRSSAVYPHKFVYCGHSIWIGSHRLWPLCLASNQHDVPEVHPCCSVNQNFAPNYSSSVFHCMDRGLGCSRFLVTMNNAPVNIHIKTFAWTNVSSCFGIYLGMQLLGPTGTACLAFGGTARLLSTAGCNFSTSSATVFIVRLFHSSRLCGRVVFSCISLTTSDMEHLFMCLLAIYIPSSGKCLLKFFAHFFYIHVLISL